MFKSNGTEQFTHDWQQGDIVTHSPNSNSDYHEIRWTSPEDGVFSISGAAWSTRAWGRQNLWSLHINNGFLTQGVLNFGPTSRATPYLFENGTAGSLVLQNLSLLKNDIIQLRIRNQNVPGVGDYVGLNLQIELVPEPSLELLLGISLIGLVGAGAVRKIRQKAVVKVKS